MQGDWDDSEKGKRLSTYKNRWTKEEWKAGVGWSATRNIGRATKDDDMIT